MNRTAKILSYELRHVLRSRAFVLYTAFFFLATDVLFRFSGEPTTALLGLANLSLLVVPLVSLMLGTSFVYDSQEFTEVLLSQPVSRRELFGGLYVGLAGPLALGLVAGIGAGLLLRGALPAESWRIAALVAASNVYLTGIFTALAFAIALHFDNRVHGMGAAIGVWLGLAVVWDGLVLTGVSVFYAYPLEKPLLVAMLANPVDLARVALLLQFDVSALMGYTGAVFREFFGGPLGQGVAFAALTAWLLVPLAFGARRFARKDM
jgi:Cu-processing system permease protein